jgi:hypothetical protein
MGWRERDYGRFNDDERSALFGGGRAEPISRPTRNRSRPSTSPATLLAVAISGAAIIFVGYVANVPGVRSILDPQPRMTPAALPPSPAPISVRWRAGDLVPALHAGRICVTDGRQGRICASFVVGELPADTLTREIERRGLHVQSSG